MICKPDVYRHESDAKEIILDIIRQMRPSEPSFEKQSAIFFKINWPRKVTQHIWVPRVITQVFANPFNTTVSTNNLSLGEIILDVLP